MSRYSPTNPAVDACLNLEAIINRQKPKELDSKSTRGLVSKQTPTATEAKEDVMDRVASYVQAIRRIRDKYKQDG
jgi:hypothetical protein|tara:strand:+ start:57 stop:281 length:225 start_codon:yes stop_codon:yes gene_type:complete